MSINKIKAADVSPHSCQPDPNEATFLIKGLNRNFLIMIKKFSYRTVSVFESKIRVFIIIIIIIVYTTFLESCLLLKSSLSIYIYIFKFYFTILKKEGIFSTVAASMHHPVRKTLQVCLTE